jgi:hypothetical protein
VLHSSKCKARHTLMITNKCYKRNAMRLYWPFAILDLVCLVKHRAVVLLLMFDTWLTYHNALSLSLSLTCSLALGSTNRARRFVLFVCQDRCNANTGTRSSTSERTRACTRLQIGLPLDTPLQVGHYSTNGLLQHRAPKPWNGLPAILLLQNRATPARSVPVLGAIRRRY